MTSKIVVNNIEADAGVSTVTFGSEISASTFNGNIVGTSATFSGNVNVAGVLTYEDVTSVDAIGLSTFQNGIHVTGGSVGIGTDNPSSILSIAKDSGNTILELKRTNTNTTGAVGTINWTASDGHSVANMYALGDGDNEGAHLVFRTTSAAGESDPYGSNTFERLRITSDGKTGINTNNPLTSLDIYAPLNISPLLIRCASDNYNYVTLNNSSDSTRGFFGLSSGLITSGGANVNDIALRATSNLVFATGGGNERLRITSGGDVNVAAGGSVFIGNGNLVFSTSGTGIDFSAASGSAAGSTSAVLDDYEEGTFTPRISVESQGSDAVIDNTSGTYVKVGQLVHCTFNADLNGIPAGRGTSFAWQWGGLPFSSLAEGSDGSEDYIGSVRIGGADHTSTYGVAAEFILRLFDNNTGGRIEVMRVSNGDIVNASLYMKDNTAINGSITYRTS